MVRLVEVVHLAIAGVLIVAAFVYYNVQSLVGCLFSRRRKSIAGQVAVVTGGANGLGRAICYQLAAKKCRIAVVDVDYERSVTVAIDISKNCGAKAKAYKVDVTDYTAIEKLRTQVEKDLGPVDILVNNAGLLFCDALHEAKSELVQNFINVNFSSHFWTVKEFLPGMIERKRGHIVAISSVAGLFTMPDEIAYSATKFAIRGFMTSLHQTLFTTQMSDFVKTTTVYPFFIDTRKDLIDTLDEKIKIKSPVLRTDKSAAAIIDAVERNKSQLVLPRVLSFLLYFNPSESLWKALYKVVYDSKAIAVNRPKMQ